MPSILIQLDEPLLKSLNRVAPVAKRQRAEFIRQAVKEAIRKREYEAIRTISKVHLVERISRIPARRIREVKRAVGYALAWEELIETNG